MKIDFLWIEVFGNLVSHGEESRRSSLLTDKYKLLMDKDK